VSALVYTASRLLSCYSTEETL